MIRFSQFAAPVVAGAALFIGVAGCSSHDRPDEVSPNAATIATGHDLVTATAPHDGTVYVWDATANKMVYTGKVQKGDEVRVDAKKNRVLFNDKVAVERDLINDHNYKVFFERSDKPDSDVASHREGATVIESGNGTTVIRPQNGGATIVQPAQPNTSAQPQQPSQPNTTIVRPDGTIERHD